MATTINSSGSKLKSSTIAKVPQVKSGIRKPVAALNESQRQQAQSQAPLQQRQLSKPSRLAKSTTTTTTLRARPTSLALRSPQESKVALPARLVPSKICASVLPKTATRSLCPTTNGLGGSVGANSNTNLTPQSTIASSSDDGENSISRPLLPNAKRGSPANKQSELLSKCDSAAGLSVEPRSCGPKNFIAIVHPQHSTQRLSSSAATTVNNKLVSPTTAKFANLPARARSESGKVNFNHKDANGRAGRESKQDGGQISVRHLKATTQTLTATTQNNLPAVGSEQNGNGFAQNNNLLSVASDSGVQHGDDKKQHGNNKQSNKRLRGRTNLSGLKTTATTTREPTEVDDAGDGDDEDEGERVRKANSCYNHAKSTLTKSPAIYFKRGINDQKAINEHIFPKPIGQQVLSLMMLDVGLLPANNHKQQPSRPSAKKSHVRLQDPLQRGDSGSGGSGAKSHLNDINGSSSLSHERDSSSRLNDCSINDCRNYEQCNNYYSLQPAHDMLRSQVRFSSQANDHSRSISLPASPRTRVDSGQINQRASGGHSEALSRALKQFFPTDRRSTRPLELNESRLLHAALPVLINEQFNHANLDLSICDNQDSHSIGSSSCSSLNHYCPPLLSLSNQLNGLKFEELVRANVDSSKKQHKRYNYGSNNLSALKTVTSTMGASKSSSDQVAQVAKQHELLTTNDLNCGSEKHHSNKIDHSDVCASPGKGSFVSKGSNEQIHNRSGASQSRLSRARSNRVYRGDESSSEFQLRRQQQPRSHSIGGQEFHSNSGYQRLKQALYTQQAPQPGAFDGYQSYNIGQLSSRTQQIPSPFQQHQQHQLLLGRSPSPLSVNCQTKTNYGSPQRECSMKYSLDRQPRNQLHASLECLNSNYSEYQQNQHQLHQQQLQHQLQQQYNHHHHQQQQQQQQLQQHHQHPIQNQHYAASYVLATPPANTTINQSGDQDLAAAAMESPSSQYYSTTTNAVSTGPYSHQTQSLINRAMAQVSQSPLRRIGLNNNTNVAGASSGILNHLSSLHHPMRAGHSSLSLASSSFIIEDKLHNEIRKLQSELKSEKEKNEALNSQLNINSSLMAAFEQSLTTLNTRLRQLTTLNEKKDEEIAELKVRLTASKSAEDVGKKAILNDEAYYSSNNRDENGSNNDNLSVNSENDKASEKNLMKLVDDLKRQLIEKDRLLTDTRLEALSAAHQLEQLESKLSGENSLLANEDDLDEGVMVVNHSPSDSDAITDSAHFSEMNSQISKPSQRCNGDNAPFTLNNTNTTNSSNLGSSTDNYCENNNVDYQSNHSNQSGDYQLEIKTNDQHTLSESVSQQFDKNESGPNMSQLLDSLLMTS